MNKNLILVLTVFVVIFLVGCTAQEDMAGEAIAGIHNLKTKPSQVAICTDTDGGGEGQEFIFGNTTNPMNSSSDYCGSLFPYHLIEFECDGPNIVSYDFNCSPHNCSNGRCFVQ